MILPPELSDLEKNFLTNNLVFHENSSIKKEEQHTSFLGEVFLTFIASVLLPTSKMEKIFHNCEGSKSSITFIDLFLQIVNLSDIISLNNPIVSRLQQFLLSDVNIKSLTIIPGFITSNLTNYSFSLEEVPFSSNTHLCPHLLSIITEYHPLISKSKKKSGKYYTLPSDAALISLLVVFRFLREKNTDLSDDMIFDLLIEDNIDPKCKNQLNDSLLSEITILDPACGSGTFLIQLVRLLSKLSKFGLSQENILRLSIDAVDLDPLPLLVTRLRFFLLELFWFIQYGSLKIQIDINIRREDFLFENARKKFDIIIGNPPFIRHEDIGSNDNPNYKKELITNFKKETNSQINIDRKSDLLIYFCLKSLNLLKKTGVLGLLTSNAWLEVNYGKTLQEYLIHLLSDKRLAQCEIIYQAGARLWKQIGINSVVFLATRNLDSQSQSQGIFFSESNSVLTQISTNELKQSMLFCRETASSNYRTEFIPISELSQTNKWAGSFLRATKEERRILKKLIAQGVPLHTIAEVRFGIKTGANDFFHLIGFEDKKTQKIEIQNKRNYTGQIEKQFLVPLVKSPSEIDNYLVSPKMAKKNWLFYCHKPKDQLKGSGALEYIQWGEKESIPIKQGRKMGLRLKGFSSLASISERELWYSINPYPSPPLLWAKSYHNKPGCFLNQGNFYPDQRFYSIYPHNRRNIPLILTFLNSSFVWALMEQAGNTNMGLGVLDTNVYWLKALSIPEMASPQQLEEIEGLMKELKEVIRREPITSESVIRTKIDEFYTNLFELTESEFSVISN
ncbi:MAG: Eco57I restriction-modification methylase domain-containing protein, partial [Candidatus Hodarchaeales archaeon]